MAGRYDPLTRTAIRGGRTTVPDPTPAAPQGTDGPGTSPSDGPAPGPRTSQAPGSAPRTAPRPGTRTWTPPGPVDLGLILGPLRRGPADPTFRATAGAVWRASRTPPARPRSVSRGTGPR